MRRVCLARTYLSQNAMHMPRTDVPLTKCDAYASHPARTGCLARREGNARRTIVIWEIIK